jgi:predicted nuclease with TOPRIM domain
MPDQRHKVSAKIEGINWEDFASPEDLKNARMELEKLRTRIAETDLQMRKIEAEKQEWEKAMVLLASENHSLKVQLDEQASRPVLGRSVDPGRAVAIETLNKQLESELKCKDIELHKLKKRIQELECNKPSSTPERTAPSPVVQDSPISIKGPAQPPQSSNPFGL